ncbi:hypothetical protein HanXRQr2_Chr02g0081071 [Helianthus annuus]|uniref:Uncharacterized protein n=1 Tax=Helianthus annuus TaxID=4232 RepID=A0A251VI77_HELAN|nr:hypothetical protein HanXRQr2_Chr02g0081071 [Helianthus annuus]KAJ0619871.1 hypothetical protein HanHA89_Chr02g0076101 [Helianthus annuus]KAJ0787305.1 hypothetical protein HanOQP8_Chr02g0081011 [Helianthus annuus]KAJ0952975.1 hypothetical protein HanPSC8_Chr02g0078551 [Helianthus annuus]
MYRGEYEAYKTFLLIMFFGEEDLWQSNKKLIWQGRRLGFPREITGDSNTFICLLLSTVMIPRWKTHRSRCKVDNCLDISLPFAIFKA